MKRAAEVRRDADPSELAAAPSVPTCTCFPVLQLSNQLRLITPLPFHRLRQHGVVMSIVYVVLLFAV
jgi:hypothetical protein